MISNFNDLTSLFQEIDNNISEGIELYIIGGAMLLYHGLKEATKDIDIIVDSQKEFLIVQNTLKKLKFKAELLTTEYKNVNLSQIFIREDFRVDLFHKIVCKGFQLSSTMKERALDIKDLKHLKIFLCSHEDVFLFKTFTQRDGDITDCLALARKQKPVNWQAILKEIKNQINISGNKVWITYIGERLDIIEEKGLEVPIMKEIDKLREEYLNNLEKKYSKENK